MITVDHFDIRTVTLGVSLRDCADSDVAAMERKISRKVGSMARRLVEATNRVSHRYGIPVANRRMAVSPLALILEACPPGGALRVARTLDRLAGEAGVDFVGGASALVQKGFTRGDDLLFEALPEILATTKHICSSVNVASTKAGVNMDAVLRLSGVVLDAAHRTASHDGIGAAKLVAFANAPEDNPFMAGAFHGPGEADMTINVGISGPGVIHHVVRRFPGLALDLLADRIKRTVFKLARVGELVMEEVAESLGVAPGIVDISLAPTPVEGDSVARIIESMGIEAFGGPGSTAALAMLNDAVKRGGAMACRHLGGLSGAFIPVAEDSGMAEAVANGALGLPQLEAMTSVCSVGLDMVPIPGDTPLETLAAIIADEMAIGVINGKATGARIIPVPGKGPGEMARFGGLFGESPILEVSPFSAREFVRRGGRIPAPIQALTN